MNTTFVDTSAFYAAMVADDPHHGRARDILGAIREGRATLVTSSYVLHETVALLQGRIGVDAVRAFHRGFGPLVRTVWIDEGANFTP